MIQNVVQHSNCIYYFSIINNAEISIPMHKSLSSSQIILGDKFPGNLLGERVTVFLSM